MATVNFIKYKKQSASALSGVTQYVSQEEKIRDMDSRQLVSGQNCTPQLAGREFHATRDVYRKDSPVWFYHYVQSFSPDEVITGEQAHHLAKEFAARAWPDSEVLIATHLDAEHIHSHFVVNAVCWESGKMLRQGPDTLRSLRQLSDELCLAHGLSVLPKEQKKQTQGMGTREYRSAAKGQSWKIRLMNAIDQCMRYSATKDDFMSLMESEGYQVRWEDSRKNITYTTPEGMKCRDDRLHELKYTKEVMEREFRIRAEIIHRGIETAESAAGDKVQQGVSLLRALSRQVGQLPTQAQLEALARDVAQMRAELKQAGKKREQRFSLPRIRLPKLHLPYISWSSLLLGLTALVLTGGVLWAVWFSWERLWSAAQTLLP